MKLNGTPIERKTSSRRTCINILGVYIDEKLDWSDHVKHIISQISRNIGILYKVRYFVSDKILLIATSNKGKKSNSMVKGHNNLAKNNIIRYIHHFGLN